MNPPGARGRIRVARSTKRIAKKAPNGVGVARALLSEAKVREELRLDPEALETLRTCSTHPPRNAMAMVSAIKLRLEYSQPKPKQEVEHSGSVEITRIERVVIDPAKT